MDPQHIISSKILTYPSIKTVLKYWPVETRRHIAKNIPALRKVNGKLGFNFQKVHIKVTDYGYLLRIDNLKWKFIENMGKNGSIVNPVEIIIPCEKLFKTLLDLAKHYLCRNNFVVREFCVENVMVKELEGLSFSRIDFLKLDLTKKPNVAQNLRVFNEVPIKRMELDMKTSKVKWNNEILNLQCTHLKVNNQSSSLDELFFTEDVRIPFKHLEIREKTTTDLKFLSMCKKFASGEVEKGSRYAARLDDDGDELWDKLKQELNVEISHKNFLSVKTTNCCEMIVKREKDAGSFPTRYNFQVKVAEAGAGDRKKMTESFICKVFTSAYSNMKYIFDHDKFFTILLMLLLIGNNIVLFSIPYILPTYTWRSLIGTITLHLSLEIAFLSLTLWGYPKLFRLLESEPHTSRCFKTSMRFYVYFLFFSAAVVLSCIVPGLMYDNNPVTIPNPIMVPKATKTLSTIHCLIELTIPGMGHGQVHIEAAAELARTWAGTPENFCNGIETYLKENDYNQDHFYNVITVTPTNHGRYALVVKSYPV